MDKYEYNVKLEQIKKLIRKKDYATAARIADTIEWYRVKNNQTIVLIADVYEASGRYEQARENLKIAYDRSGLGRQIAYKLVKICIKCGDIEEAEDFYDDFESAAPRDISKYLLQYELAKAKGESIEKQISILEQYLEDDMDDRWAYELAKLYHKSGQRDKCINQCDTVMLWFSDGKYVEKAMDLKMIYTPLTKSQQERYEARWRQKSVENNIKIEEIKVKEVDVANKYNTQNIQAALKESMEALYQTDKKDVQADIFKPIPSVEETSAEQEMPEEYIPEPEEMDADSEDNAQYDEVAENIDSADDYIQRMAQNAENYNEIKPCTPEEVAKQTLVEKEESDGFEDFEDDHDDFGDTKVFRTTRSMRNLGDTKIFDPRQLNIPEQVSFEEPYILEEKTIHKEEENFKVEEEQTPEAEEPEVEEEQTPETEEQIPEAEEPAAVEIAEAEQLEFDLEVPENPEEQIEGQMNIEDFFGDDGEYQIPEEDTLIEDDDAEEIMEAEEEPIVESIDETEDDTEDILEAEEETVEEPEIVDEELEEVSEEQEDTESGIDLDMIDDIMNEEEQFEEEAAVTEEDEEVEDEEFEESEEDDLEVEELDMEEDEETEIPEVEEMDIAGIIEEETDEETAEEPEIVDEELEAETEENESETESETQEEIEETEETESEIPEAIDPFETVTDLKIDKKMIRHGIEEEKTEESDDEAEEEEEKKVLTNEEIKEIIKDFIGKYSGVKGLDKQMLKTLQNVIVNDNCNVFIMGDAKSGKTSLGIDLIKVVNKIKRNNNRRIAKISAEKLNGKDLGEYFDKLAGSDLFIENITLIDEETLENLYVSMEKDFDSRIVVLEDEKLNAEKFLEKNEKIKKYFANTITVKQNKIKDWVSVATEYATGKGYEIDEMGLLALHAKIDQLYGITMVIQKNHVEGIIDSAIKKAEKGGFLKKLFGKKKEKILTEEHFN